MPWQATAEPDEYIAPLGGKRFLKIFPYTEIDQYNNRKGPVSAALCNDKQEILVDMTTDVDGIELDELKELALSAKRRALKIDEQVDEVLKELGRMDIPF